MNRAGYKGDPRYWSVWEKMQLLGIKDVSSAIQEKNGTIIWRLPIRNNNSGKTFIEVGSFSTGYVRNQNSGYSNYQLNKRCESEPQYFDSGRLDEIGRPMYTKFTTKSCKLIPIEIDRLEYLLSYCIKNYFIKRANEVADGSYVSQWYHEYEMNRLQNKLANSVPKWKYDEANETYGENTGAMARIGGLEDRIYELESQVDVADTRVINLKLQNEVLQNKLATINKISE